MGVVEEVGEEVVVVSPPTPSNKLKFLCSYGGKILPRPFDGRLRYVGGETRVVAVPRHITFSELKKKLTSMVNGDVVFKYQLAPEDLDALVSVTCDEDLKYMLEEADRHDAKLGSRNSNSNGATPRLRTFLFPANPLLIDHHHHHIQETNVLDQRYIDAINGLIRTNSSNNANRSIFSISSPRSSLNYNATATPDYYFSDALGDAAAESANRYTSQELGIGRVRSSPNLASMGQPTQPQFQQSLSRFARPTRPLQTSFSDASRYQMCQPARRNHTPGCPQGWSSGGYAGHGLMEGSNVYRSSGSGGSFDGDTYPISPGKQRCGISMRPRWDS